jgi:hypothetical protein
MKKILYTCPECGSDQMMHDAYVMMNDEDDVRIFDNKVCDTCGRDTNAAIEVEIDVPDDLPIDVAVSDPAPGGRPHIARDLVHYFDTWELVLPPDARAALAPLAQAAREYWHQTKDDSIDVAGVEDDLTRARWLAAHRVKHIIDVAVPDPEPKVLRGDELLYTTRAMDNFGGGFSRAIANALRIADSTNAARLQQAFPEMFEKYGPGTGFYTAMLRDGNGVERNYT